MNNKHVYHLHDKDTSTSEALRHIGSLTVRYGTGEAYVTILDKNNNPKQVLLKGETYRRFLDFLNKNRIVTVIPFDKSDLENKTNIYLDTNTNIPDSMETVSVHNILIERTYEDLIEGSAGLAKEKTVTLKRLSMSGLAKDISIHDNRVKSDGSKNGIVNAEDLMNYILNVPLDLDPVFSLNSNLRLFTDKDDLSTDYIRLELNTMDNPVSETRAEKFVDRLITGKGAKEIIGKIDKDIESIRTFSKLQITDVGSDGTNSMSIIDANTNHDTLNLKANYTDKLSIGVDENDKIYFKHIKVDNASVSISYQAGKIIAIKSIKTDGYGHVTEISTEDINSIINAIYYNKNEIDSTYLNKSNTGTEIMNGGLDIVRGLTVRNSVKILGDLITAGTSTTENTKEMIVKDTLLDIGSGNDSSYRYIGIRLVKGVDGSAGTAGKDAFVVYDRTDARFKFVHANVSPSDKNEIYGLELADIEANNIFGNAATASKLKNAIKLLFTGDVSGSTEFFGDEGTKTIELSIKKASATNYGIVKLLEEIPDTQPTDEASVFSAGLLFDQFDSYKTFGTYTGYESDSTDLVATASSVNSVYKLLVDFRTKYDAQALIREQAAIAARTSLYSTSGIYEADIVLDSGTTASANGVGYDLYNYDKSVSLGKNYPEFWNLKYALKVSNVNDSTLFNVMPRRTGLAYISLPKLNNVGMNGFVFNTGFVFKIYEYDTQTSDKPVSHFAISKSPYSLNKTYKEIDYSESSSEDTKLYDDRFYNLASFRNISNYVGKNNVYQITDEETKEFVTCSTTPTIGGSDYTKICVSGVYNTVLNDATGPFGSTEAVLKIHNGKIAGEGTNWKSGVSASTKMNEAWSYLSKYNNYKWPDVVGDNLTVNRNNSTLPEIALGSRIHNNMKKMTYGLCSTLEVNNRTVVDKTKPLLVAFYVKFKRFYNNNVYWNYMKSTDDTSLRSTHLSKLNYCGGAFTHVDEHFSATGIFGVHVKAPKNDGTHELLHLVTSADTQYSNVTANLSVDKWYCVITFAGNSTQSFKDTENIRGVYDMDTATKVMTLGDISNFKSDSVKLDYINLSININNCDAEIASPVITKWGGTNGLELNKLITKNKQDLFYVEKNISAYTYTYDMKPTDPKKWYSIECEISSGSVLYPASTPFGSASSMGSFIDDLSSLKDENYTTGTNGVNYVIESSNDYSVSLNVKQTKEVLDPKVTPDVWLDSVSDYSFLALKYLNPKNNDIIVVQNDTNHGNVATRYVYSTSTSKWKYLGLNVDYTWLTALSAGTDPLIYYNTQPNGSYVKINNDADHSNVQTIHYKRDGAWEYLISASSLNRLGDKATLALIKSSYPSPVNNDMCVATSEGSGGQGLMYIYTGGAWVSYGEFQGWNLLASSSTWSEFLSKYTVPTVTSAVKCGDIWYTWNGSAWISQGTYVAYNVTPITMPVLYETTETAIDTAIKNLYTIPKNGEYVKVTNDTTLAHPGETYYKFNTSGNTFDYVGYYVDYVLPIQNKILEGSVSLDSGYLKHRMNIKYKTTTST